MSSIVITRAWPAWSEPVALVGGMIMVKDFWASAPGRLSGLKKPLCSQSSYILASVSLGLYGLRNFRSIHFYHSMFGEIHVLINKGHKGQNFTKIEKAEVILFIKDKSLKNVAK